LRQLEDNFVHDLEVLRDEFNHEKFFAWELGYAAASEIIRKWQVTMEKQDDEAAEIQANGEPLEFMVNPFKNLGLMKADLALLELVWETAHRIETELQAWKSTLWAEFEVAKLSSKCDEHTNEWSVYNGMYAPIKSVSCALPMLDQLHNAKLRERHWQRPSDARLEVAGLDTAGHSGKELMRFSEEITEIVEGASNEVRMETQVADLNNTWKAMEHFAELLVLNVPEELVQTLEEDQVAVQNYLLAKNISFFKATLTEWQNNLVCVDRVITVWLDVQYHWTHLRPIFIGSEDIRRQLPTQSAPFENIKK
jgi:dynein heavy chain